MREGWRVTGTPGKKVERLNVAIYMNYRAHRLRATRFESNEQVLEVEFKFTNDLKSLIGICREFPTDAVYSQALGNSPEIFYFVRG